MIDRDAIEEARARLASASARLKRAAEHERDLLTRSKRNLPPVPVSDELAARRELRDARQLQRYAENEWRKIERVLAYGEDS